MSNEEKIKVENDFFLFKRGIEFKKKMLYITTEKEKKALFKEFKKEINIESERFKNIKKNTDIAISKMIKYENNKVIIEKLKNNFSKSIILKINNLISNKNIKKLKRNRLKIK
ncbi:MAG: hypothetical protein Q9M97_10520 [Candidatus Gracilibacteria bacterium]|nr:hypothetical protein [Candidatus Gracilibacteria bacterium]